MKITAFDLAQRFVGVRELPGQLRNPQIMAMLLLDAKWPEDDSVAWCSAFLNYIAWLLRLPRSKDLRARSWLSVGMPIGLDEAKPGWDVIVLSRGPNAPGPEQMDAPGHVGFYAGVSIDGSCIYILGGNQDDSVNVSAFRIDRVLGLRRLYSEDV